MALVCCAGVGAAQRKEKIAQGIPDVVVPMGLGVNIPFIEPPSRDVEMIAAAGFRHVPKLKIEQVWMNVYHGGTTPSPYDQHLFIDNVVIARQYVGPMKWVK